LLGLWNNGCVWFHWKEYFSSGKDKMHAAILFKLVFGPNQRFTQLQLVAERRGGKLV